MKNSLMNSRRKFIGTLATGATAGLSAISSPLLAGKQMDAKVLNDADDWFEGVKGEQRVVYDAPEPHAGFPFIWSWVFYQTNNQTGLSDDEMTAMVVLRHNAIPFALKDQLWEKYPLGEIFNIVDNNTGAPSKRNPFFIPKDGDYPMPGIDGIKQLHNRGAMFCVCDMALKVYSGMAAQQLEMDPEEVKADWTNGVLPEVQIVPSGVWALSRAQKKDCAYIYAGG
ncbi:Tat (twin-arginine translocation) pathway signal sequence containing protein [Cyclobacterium plantarum]|uniref:Tat (Twin-arginine translocation) pathway signal sequence containing protein n=1 Tax=Cyclobacterium plantarum TaxID=2716263 RepID=A0ABX0HCT8_9BACT|nr:Tat (twin-arginine translocation) pathway signal sequence containing protein [Cyclobacterium plantarum]NHE58733.1 Tat (twin-arginine translocation) pathway signal sequence containing protein [Cyclobacterium plantarum]